MEQLSVCPEFVIFPGLSEEKNRPIIEFKNLVIHFLKEMEKEKKKKEKEKMQALDHQEMNRKQSLDLTPLSTLMSSRSAEITLRQYMASPKGSLWAGKRVAKLMYVENITWEQLREAYGTMSLF
jgi:hypothetical protein